MARTSERDRYALVYYVVVLLRMFSRWWMPAHSLDLYRIGLDYNFRPSLKTYTHTLSTNGPVFVDVALIAIEGFYIIVL
jgi:hypothetical protein